MALSAADNGDGGGKQAAGRIMAGLFVFTLLLHLAEYAASATGGYADGDGYLRVMRVEHLLRTGDWFDGAIPRINAPYGDTSHWTRPLDILIAILAAPLIPVFGLRDAVYWGGAISNPLLHAGATVAMVWAARPLVGLPAATLAAIVSVVQPAVFINSGFNRADHHALFIFLAALGLGFMLRALDPHPAAPRWAMGAGLVTAAAIWVGPEATVFLALCFSGLGLSWLFSRDDPNAEKLFMFARGLAGGLIAALLIERGPSGLAAVEYDRLSIVHVGIGGLAFGGIWAIRRIGRLRPLRRATEKFLVGAACGSAMAGVWLWLFPDAIHGPMAHVASDVKAMVYGFILEYESALSPARFPALLGGALLALPYLAWRAPEIAVDPRRWAWLFVLIAIMVYGALSTAWVRWSVYIGLFPCVALGDALQRIVVRIQAATMSRFRRELATVSIVAAVIVGPLATAAVAAWAFGTNDSVVQEKRGLCRTEALTRTLNRPPWSDRSRIVLTGADHGPELVYRTPHRAVASLYHRNTAGLVDLSRAFEDKGDDVAREIVERRGIDLIAICPPMGNDGGDLRSLEPGALYRRLIDGHPPSWLRRVDTAAPGSAFELYEVVSEKGRR